MQEVGAYGLIIRNDEPYPRTTILEGHSGVAIPSIMMAQDQGGLLLDSVSADLSGRVMVNVPAAGLMVPEELQLLKVGGSG